MDTENMNRAVNNRQQYKRHTAYKFWIKDLAEAVPKRDDTTFFEIRGKRAIRVNVLANVIHKYLNPNNSYGLIVLDDGSGQIRVKAWDEDARMISPVQVGNCVLVIGRLAHINNETFIRPEIVKVISNMEWELVRKLELNREYGKPERKDEILQTVMEDVYDDAPVEPTIAAREKIVNIIEKHSDENGIEITKIIELSKINPETAEKVVEELLKEGEAYQPRQGYVKMI